MGIQSEHLGWIPAASSYLRKMTPDLSSMSRNDIKDMHFRFAIPRSSRLDGYVTVDGKELHFCTIPAAGNAFRDIRTWLEESGTYSPNGDQHTGVVTIDGPVFSTRMTLTFAGRLRFGDDSHCNLSRLTIERSDMTGPLVDCLCLSNRTRKRLHSALTDAVRNGADIFDDRREWDSPSFWSEGGRSRRMSEIILDSLRSRKIDAIFDDGSNLDGMCQSATVHLRHQRR